jgi:3-phosphoshikimate 1-carboxyvinyltransferase
MGAALLVENERVEGGEPVGDLRVRAGALQAADVPAARAPSMIDEYPVLAVACAAANGVSRLRGLDELRVKESDRFASTMALLECNNIRVTAEGDDMLIEGTGGRIPGGGRVETRMDHRLAMSGIVLGLAAEAPVTIDDIAFIETSFPGFVPLMNELGASLSAEGPVSA